MLAVVLSGGLGVRMGALTKKRQKTTLMFQGRPIIDYVLSCLLRDERIQKVYVLTGHCLADVHQVAESQFGQFLNTGKLAVLDFPDVRGAFNRFFHSLQYFARGEGVCVCSGDIIVPDHVTDSFLFVADSKKTTILLSPRLLIAPTHGWAKLREDKVVEYVGPHSFPVSSDATEGWLGDVGVRYLSPEALEWIRRNLTLESKPQLDFSFAIQELVRGEVEVRGVVFNEDWGHFGVPQDFKRSS